MEHDELWYGNRHWLGLDDDDFRRTILDFDFSYPGPSDCLAFKTNPKVKES